MPAVTLAYPNQITVLPTIGVIAIYVQYLIGQVDTAKIDLRSTTNHLIVTAVRDSAGNEGRYTLHAFLPRITPGTYAVHVILHDEVARCGAGPDQFDLPDINVGPAAPGDPPPPEFPKHP